MVLVASGSAIAMEMCEAKDWNVSATFCSSEPVPVLPACFQHVVLSLPPLVFIIFGAFQIFGAATRNKLKVRHFNFSDKYISHKMFLKTDKFVEMKFLEIFTYSTKYDTQ